MKLIKREELHFSEAEATALELAIELMNQIVRESDDQELRDTAKAVSIDLNTILCDFSEGY